MCVAFYTLQSQSVVQRMNRVMNTLKKAEKENNNHGYVKLKMEALANDKRDREEQDRRRRIHCQEHAQTENLETERETSPAIPPVKVGELP